MAGTYYSYDNIAPQQRSACTLQRSAAFNLYLRVIRYYITYIQFTRRGGICNMLYTHNYAPCVQVIGGEPARKRRKIENCGRQQRL